MIINIPDGFDSKFRFILVAAERAKQLQHGAPPKVKLKARKPAYVAIKEAEKQLIPFAILEEEEGDEK